jgi:hypothetical protein
LNQKANEQITQNNKNKDYLTMNYIGSGYKTFAELDTKKKNKIKREIEKIKKE